MLRKFGAEVEDQLDAAVRQNPLRFRRVRRLALQGPKTLDQTIKRSFRGNLGVAHCEGFYPQTTQMKTGLGSLPDLAICVLDANENNLFGKAIALFEVKRGDADGACWW